MTLINFFYKIINIITLFIVTLIFKNNINSFFNFIINYYHDEFLYKNIILIIKSIYFLLINYFIDNKYK